MPQQPQNPAWAEADAQARIEAARRDGATALDLSGLRLRAVPESVLDLPGLRELDLSGNRLRDVPPMIRHVPDVTKLNLSDNLLLELPDWLGERGDLTELDVGGNQLLGVPAWLGGFTRLTGLGLDSCGLTEVPPWLSRLDALTELDLYGNWLAEIPGWVGDLSALTQLDLGSNHLRSLPRSLTGLAGLSSLDVGSNQLRGLPAWIGDFAELTEFTASACGINELPASFSRLRRVTYLSLRDNRLDRLPTWLGDLTEVRKLDFYGNSLSDLPESLARLSKLSAFNMGDNRLQSLPEWLGEFPELVVLNLDDNEWFHVPDCIGDLGKLSDLTMGSCRISEVPEWVRGLTKLIRLSLHGNQLTRLPEWLGELRELETLTLRGNQLRTLPDSLAQLGRLRVLDIGANQIAKVPDWIGDLKALTSLRLGDTPVAALPDRLARLANLEHLDVSATKLTALPGWIGRLPRLSNVAASDLKLTEVPPCLRHLDELASLDLSENAISALPEWLGDLAELTWLGLYNNQLDEIPEFVGNLGRLQTLYVFSNRIMRLPKWLANAVSLTRLFVSSNGFIGLPDLGNLRRLRSLDIGNCGLTEVPSWIVNLRGLELLRVIFNDISVLPAWIGKLDGLRNISLLGNKLTGVPEELGMLSGLTELNLSRNRIAKIPNMIGVLENLETLYLNGNQLAVVPDSLLDLPLLEGLSLSDNPLVSPPPEIAESGTESVLAFLRARRQGASRQWVSKLLVVGEGGVGKTSLIKALLNEEYDPAEPTTHAIRLSDVFLPHPEHDGVRMRLSTWDFGGQEVYHATHQFFLTDRSLFLLLWNSRLGWEQGKLEYWLDIIKSRAPESPVLLVATHADASQRPVDLPLDDLVRDYPQVVGNLVIDNETRTGLGALRDELARRAAGLPLMGAEWPTTWLNAAEAVKGAPAKHITPDAMWRLMTEAGVTDQAQQRYLAVAMHALGDILYYSDDPDLEQTVVLRPEWVNEYISLVLDSKPVDEGRGLLSRAEVARLWSSLDRGMRDHFLGMMDKYEISFRVDGGETGVVSLVVERLPWNPPEFEEEWGRLADVPGTQEIRVRYQLNTMPPGIPTWFIARSHRFTTSTHWRTGALLAHHDGAHQALLRAQPRRNSVELTVRGPNPAAFFSILDDGFQQTLLRYPGLEINRLVPCPCGQGCTEQFDYGDLQRRLTMSPPRHDIECRKSGEMLNVPRLLLGLAPSERDSARTGIERLTAMLDELLSNTAKQSEKIDGLTASVASQAEYLQRTFLKLTRLIQESQEARCPSVFAVVPVKTGVTGAHYEIRLYCEEPGAVHPLAGDDSCYPVTEPSEWLRKVRPHLRQLLTVLKHAAPLAGPVLGTAVGHVSDRVGAELDAMKEVVDQIPEFSRDLDLPGKEGQLDAGPAERASSEADFRALERLLLKLDPDRRWGGLSRTVTPEGLTLYLCRDHADAYRRAVRL